MLHDLNTIFERETGVISRVAFAFRYDAQTYWAAFTNAGYGESELLIVLNYLKAQIQKGKRQPGCLRLRNLVGDVPSFEFELHLAKESKLRFKPAPTPRQDILRALNKREVVGDNAIVTPGPVVAKLLAELKAAAE